MDEDEFGRLVLPIVLPVIAFAMGLWVCVPLLFMALSVIFTVDRPADISGPAIGVVVSLALGVALVCGPFMLSDVRADPRRRRRHVVTLVVLAVIALVVALMVALGQPNQPLDWLAVGLYFTIAALAVDRLRRGRAGGTPANIP